MFLSGNVYTYIHKYSGICISFQSSVRQTARMAMVEKNDIHGRMMEKICEQGVVDNIWRFARERLSDMLSLDVRSYRQDVWLINAVYNANFSPDALTSDLIAYMACETSHKLADGTVAPGPEYLNANTEGLARWRRYHIHPRMGASHEERKERKRMMAQALGLNLTTRTDYRDVNGQNRRLIGMLTPRERTAFINEYVLAE